MSDRTYVISPHTFYYRDQPAGVKGRLYVQDTLKGNRMVDIDRLILEGDEFFAMIGEDKVSMLWKSGVQVTYTGDVKYGLHPAVADVFESFDAFIDDENVKELLDDPERFEANDKTKKMLGMIADAGARILDDAERRGEAGNRIPHAMWLQRVETISQLVNVIDLVERGNYDAATGILSTVGDSLSRYQAEVRKIVG